MQRLEFAFAIPPAAGQGFEFGDFRPVDIQRHHDPLVESAWPRSGPGVQCVHKGLAAPFVHRMAGSIPSGFCSGQRHLFTGRGRPAVIQCAPGYNDVFPLESFMQFQPQSADQRGVQALQWCGDSLRILDQRYLPEETLWIECRDAVSVAEAIRDGVLQGAASVGIAAAYGIALAARHIGQAADWPQTLSADFALLAAARPSAEHLGWALQMLQD